MHRCKKHKWETCISFSFICEWSPNITHELQMMNFQGVKLSKTCCICEDPLHRFDHNLHIFIFQYIHSIKSLQTDIIEWHSQHGCFLFGTDKNVETFTDDQN